MKCDSNKFGERLALRRTALGLTQQELGLLIWPEKETDTDSVNAAYRDNVRKKINSYEKKNVTPPLDSLCKLANHLDCSADYLLGAISLPNHETADIQAKTGLSNKAICSLDALVAFASGFDGHPEKENINVLRFYSEFISNDDLINVVAASSLAIDNIRKNGLPLNLKSFFKSHDPESEAINYYTYLIEQSLIGFVKDFVFSHKKHLPIIEYDGFNIPENDEEYEKRRKHVIEELEKYNGG